jgi:hypothetical protein
MDCTALTVVEQPALPAELTAALELAADFARASKAKATQEAYGSDFRIFNCRPPLSHCAPSWPIRLPSGSVPALWDAGWRPCGISTALPATRRRPATRR